MDKHSNVQIRTYRLTDYPRIKEILQESDLFYEKTDAENRLRNKIKRDPESILVATENNKIVGTVTYMEDSKIAIIFRLAVAIDYRKKGIGKKLMEYAGNILAIKGYEEIHLLVNPKNKSLQDYYKKIGYEEGELYMWMYRKLT